MIKALEIAIEKLKRLPEDKQAYAAEVIEEIAAADEDVFRIPDDYLPGVLEGLARRSARSYVIKAAAAGQRGCG